MFYFKGYSKICCKESVVAVRKLEVSECKDGTTEAIHFSHHFCACTSRRLVHCDRTSFPESSFN